MTVNEDYLGTEGMEHVDASLHVTYADYFTNEFHRFEAYYDEDGCVTWPQVLERFVDFLSGVYGYDIKKNIALIRKYRTSPVDRWSGPVVDIFEGTEDKQLSCSDD